MSWISYAEEIPRLQAAADARDRQKQNYASSHQWANGSTHLIGLVGEWCYGRMIKQEPNLALLAAGDGGWDFAGVDVKTSTYLSDPDLKVLVSDFDKGAWAYALVVVDQQKQLAAYAGWARAETVKLAPLKDYGHGPCRALNWSKLERWTIP